MVCNTSPFQDAFAHKIWNSYLKEFRRYAPDSMQFLETRPEVKFKVTVTKLWYGTLPHSKMHLHTPNLRFLPQIILEICSEYDYSKNKVRGLGHRDLKMVCDTLSSKYAFTHQIWNSYLKEYRNMHQNQCRFKKVGQRSSSRSKWPNYGTRYFLISRCIHTPNSKFLPQII